MADDEALADRIRRAVGPRPDVTEKKMFGGLAFLLGGKMFCGIVKDDLMVRVGPDRYDAALIQSALGRARIAPFAKPTYVVHGIAIRP